MEAIAEEVKVETVEVKALKKLLGRISIEINKGDNFEVKNDVGTGAF